jgi:hypothetical protein
VLQREDVLMSDDLVIAARDAGLVDALANLVCELGDWGRGRLWPFAPEMGGRRLLQPSAERLEAAYDAAEAALAAHRQRQPEPARTCGTCCGNATVKRKCWRLSTTRSPGYRKENQNHVSCHLETP